MNLNIFLVIVLHKLAKDMNIKKITCIAKNRIVVRCFCNLGFVIVNEPGGKRKCDEFKVIPRQENADEWRYVLKMEFDMEKTTFKAPVDWDEIEYISELRDKAIGIKEDIERHLETYNESLTRMKSEFEVFERDTLYVLRKRGETDGGLVFTHRSGIVEYDEQQNAGKNNVSYIKELQELCKEIDRPMIARNVVNVVNEDFFKQVENGFQVMTEKKKTAYIYVPSPESLSRGGGSVSHGVWIGFGLVTIIVAAFCGR